VQKVAIFRPKTWPDSAQHKIAPVKFHCYMFTRAALSVAESMHLEVFNTVITVISDFVQPSK